MEKEDIEIAGYIHYPECWDTMAYPTLASALWGISGIKLNTKCPTCKKPLWKKE